jgi:hypothetical protein
MNGYVLTLSCVDRRAASASPPRPARTLRLRVRGIQMASLIANAERPGLGAADVPASARSRCMRPVLLL